MFSIQSAKVSLKSSGARQFQCRADRQTRIESVQKPRSRTVTVTVKNHKTSHWFLCYKFIKGLIVVQPSETVTKPGNP
jgi:hypothetical protein